MEVEDKPIRMRYGLNRSLLHMAGVKIVISLWYSEDVYTALLTLHKTSGYQSFEKIYSKNLLRTVTSKVSQLPLPRSLKISLRHYVKPIVDEMSKWVAYQDNHVFHEVHKAINYLDDVHWTSRGTIDYKKTADYLCKYGELRDETRYRMACTYCLENHIYPAAAVLSECNTIRNWWERYVTYNDDAVAFWTSQITGVGLIDNEYGELTGYEYMLFYAIDFCNEEAVKYYWGKLSDEMKRKNMLSALREAADRRGANIMCFLLSQMDEKRQKEAFENFSFYILRVLFYDWQWRDFFLPTLHSIWHVLLENSYYAILEAVTFKIPSQRSSNDKYRDIFEELWISSPQRFKEYVFEDDGYKPGSVISRLVHIEDINAIKLMLSSATEEQRKGIMYSNWGMKTCSDLLCREKWGFANVLLDSMFSARDEILEFKKKFIAKEGCDIYSFFEEENHFAAIERLSLWCYTPDDDASEAKT